MKSKIKIIQIVKFLNYLFCLAILLFIRKSSRIHALNEFGDSKVNDFVVESEIEDKLIELTKQVNGYYNDNRST